MDRKAAAKYRARDEKGKFSRNSLPSTIAPSANVDHVWTFQGLNGNLVSKTYRNPDEAMRHSWENARTMRREGVLMECLRARQMATAELPWSIEPEDADDLNQKQIAEEITKQVENIPRFLELKRNLLEAIWFGRYAVALDYGWQWPKGNRELFVRSWQPIHGDKLVFKWDTDQFGYLVGKPTTGREVIVTERGRAELVREWERDSFIVHKHEIEDGEFEDGLTAGAIHGVGIRSRIYWTWWHKQQLLGWLMDTCQTYPRGGFQIWYFEAGNDASMKAVKEAAENQTENHVLLVPRSSDGTKLGAGLEIVEPKSNVIELFQHLIDDYFDNVIRRYILGQTLSGKSDATGLGSGVADLQETTFNKIVRYDAENLAETLTTDLVRVLHKYNFPDYDDFQLRFKFNIDRPEPEKFLQGVKDFCELGGSVSMAQVRGVLGLSEPKAGEAVLGKQPSLAPNETPLPPGLIVADENSPLPL